MEPYAARLLKLVLDKCQGASFSEIRFVSGMSPAFVDENGPHFINVETVHLSPYLSQEIVGEVHELCLSLADARLPGAYASITYTFELRRLGRVLCKYQRRGNVASLVLERDSDALETIDAIRPTKRPSLRAEAKPGPKKKRD